MSRSALAFFSICLALTSPSAGWAQKQPPLRFLTVDGTWDCKDNSGTAVGTIILADTSHAFITTEGKLGGYGKISNIDGDFHFPKFVVSSGYLKDKMNVIGLSIRGPEKDPENFNGELYLFAVVGIDAKQHWNCV